MERECKVFVDSRMIVKIYCKVIKASYKTVYIYYATTYVAGRERFLKDTLEINNFGCLLGVQLGNGSVRKFFSLYSVVLLKLLKSYL